MLPTYRDESTNVAAGAKLRKGQMARK
jgi:hypothetical protein